MSNFADDIENSDRFRLAADAVTNTAWGQLERDLAERIAALEAATGLQDDPAHRAYVVEQQDIGERIAAAADPAERAELRREKDAHSQDYAADLLERGQLDLGNEGHYEEAATMKQEAALRREIAAELRGQGPEITPPEQTERDPAEIGRSMAEASGLGPTAQVAVVVEGPSAAEERGQLPDPHEIKSEAGRSDYAALREATAEAAFEGEQPAPTNPENAWLIMPVAVPDGGLATVRQPGFDDRPTDYENGPTRPGTATAMESLADTRAVAETDERVVEDERIALAAEKEKRAVEDTGRVMSAATSEGDTADPFAAMMQTAAKNKAALERVDEAEASLDTGRAAMGGGRSL